MQKSGEIYGVTQRRYKLHITLEIRMEFSSLELQDLLKPIQALFSVSVGLSVKQLEGMELIKFVQER